MKNLLIYIIIIGAFSCTKKIDSVPTVESFLQNKIEGLRKERLTKCKEKAIQDADTHIDSIIDKIVRNQIPDTTTFPNRPIKPTRPEDIIGN